jgi:LmbE family N-acetylglucosaminyl deacetylase
MKKIVFALIFFSFPVAMIASAKPPREEILAALRAMPELSQSFPELSLPTGTSTGALVAIFAHADDELTLLAQMASLQHRYPERPFYWILVSDSGKGRIQEGKCVGLSPALCRALEVRRAAECFGLAAPYFMNLPDGGLEEISSAELAQSIQALLKALLGDQSPALILSHDPAGLYGHADHVAVYDAVEILRTEQKFPLVTVALPDFLKRHLPRRPPGSGRELVSITHQYTLRSQDIDRLECAFRAHASQSPTLAQLLFGLEPREFFEAAPRHFLHVH